MSRFASAFLKITLALTLVGAFLLPSQAQTTNVTATIINAGIPYGNGTYAITFVPNTTSGLPANSYRLNGATFTQSFTGSLNSSGILNVTIADNTIVSPSGSTWLFRICSLAGNTCFTLQSAVSTASQSLTTQLSAVSLPVQGQTKITSPATSIDPAIVTYAAGNQSGIVVWKLLSPDGTILFSIDGAGNVVCAGTGCSGGGGSGPTIQANGTPLTSQNPINFQDAAVFNGVTLTWTNPSLGNLRPSLSGSFANTALANSSVTISTSGCIAGGASVALGGTLPLTSANCLSTSSTLANLAASSSAQLFALLTDKTGTGLAVFQTAPTFVTSITTPVLISGAGDPADAGMMRLGNAEVIAWEHNPTGTDATLGVDTSNILQSSVAFNSPTLTEGGSAVPNSTDNLGFFGSTTSAQFAGVISNETGSAGFVVLSISPVLTGTPTTPTAAPLTGGTQIASQAYVDAAVTAGGGGGGANPALSNLAVVAINTTLVSDTDNTDDLGTNAIKWRTGYFGTSVITPQVATSGTNGGIDGLEGTGASLTIAASHDLLWADSTAHRWKVSNNNGAADTPALFTDKLSVFAATTSAELAGVLSDEVGSGFFVRNGAPSFTTSITTPVLISTAADPADAGVIRLGNTDVIAWEAATPGTDLTMQVNASNIFAFSAPVSATTGFQIGGAAPSGHFPRGNGTNYVDGTIQAGDLPASAAIVVASGTSALGTSAITSGSCASIVTTTATGTATTSKINFTPNADISAVTGYTPATSGSLIIYPFPTANNVNFKVCNPTSSSITPGAVTLNWVVF